MNWLSSNRRLRWYSIIAVALPCLTAISACDEGELPGNESPTEPAAPGGDLGQGDGSDVVTIGDSYMLLLTTGIQVSLERVSGQDYRNYAFPGTRMLDNAIPNQYARAISENPNIKTVVMTGGGNDILFTSCRDEDCFEIVDRVSDRTDELLAQMAADGVQDVVLVGYGYPADESRHASLDYSRSLIPTRCQPTGTPRCHYVDTVDELSGMISFDGIHPTGAGYDMLGQMVWDLMREEGMRR